MYSKAIAFFAELKGLYEAEKSKLPPSTSLRRRSVCLSNLKSVEEFHAKPIYAGDQTRMIRLCRLRFGPRNMENEARNIPPRVIYAQRR